MISKRIAEINSRKLEIRSMLESNEEVKLDEVQSELESLEGEEKELRSKQELASKINAGEVEMRTIEKSSIKEDKKVMEMRTKEEIYATPEYRSAFFKHLLGKEMTEVEKRDWLAGAGQTAEAVIPIETSNMIFDYMVKTAPMLNEITLMRVAGNLRFAVEGVRADAALHTQNAAIVPAAADSLTFVTLGGFEFVKIQRISATVKAMAIPAFEQWLAKTLAEDIAEQLESEIILGTNVTGGVEDAQVWADGTTGIDYGAQVTYDDIVDLIALLPARNDRNAKFLMNKAMFYNQIAKVQDANGQPIVVRDVVNGAQPRIMGYPVIISDVVGAGNAYLGDFTKIVGNLSQDVRIESSAQSGFLNNAIDFRGTCIFDCDHATANAFVKLFT